MRRGAGEGDATRLVLGSVFGWRSGAWPGVGGGFAVGGRPVLGPTRVIWEIGGGPVILAATAWVARLRAGPRKAAGAHVGPGIDVTTAEP